MRARERKEHLSIRRIGSTRLIQVFFRPDV